MNAKEVIDLLEDSFLTAKEMGLSSVTLETLKQILDRARETAVHTPEELARYEVALERYRHILAARNMRWSNRLETTRTMVGHTINAGAGALKAATLINGAAAVALLAFAGQAQGSPSGRGALGLIATALGCFAGGVLASAVAAGATYLSQAAFGREFVSWSVKTGEKWRGVALVSVLLSLMLFVAGGTVSALAIDAMAWNTSKSHKETLPPRPTTPAKPTKAK